MGKENRQVCCMTGIAATTIISGLTHRARDELVE